MIVKVNVFFDILKYSNEVFYRGIFKWLGYEILLYYSQANSTILLMCYEREWRIRKYILIKEGDSAVRSCHIDLSGEERRVAGSMHKVPPTTVRECIRYLTYLRVGPGFMNHS